MKRPLDLMPEKPLRAPILTIDQLRTHGARLVADDNSASSNRQSAELRRRFRENGELLQRAYRILGEAARGKEILTPGAEWLLDNFHIVEQQIQDIKLHFPRGYDRILPKLTSGELKGYPRVYRFALELVTRSDAIIDSEILSSFISGIQSKTPLTSGELWAVPIMLKFALVENLRRLIASILTSREERKEADLLMRELFHEKSLEATEILLTFAKRVEDNPTLIALGAVHLIRRLRERGAKAMLTLQWLEEKLRERKIEPEDLLREDYQSQALDQVSIGNTVTSLRSMGTIDWRSWFERMSVVHAELVKDPAKVYLISDFETRDIYRHHIERIARSLGVAELDIAAEVVKIAEGHKDEIGLEANYRSHVGYYLIDNGRQEFEARVGFSASLGQKIGRFLKKNALLFYLSSIVVVSALFILLGLNHIKVWDSAFSYTALFLVVFLIPASDIATSFVQWFVSHLTVPSELPKLDFQKSGVPKQCRTLVAVHGIHDETLSLKQAIDGIEVRYLGNKDPNIFFCFLTDLPDRPTTDPDQDSHLIDYGRRLIRKLNEQYASHEEIPRFYILFRERKWNPVEKKYMAWERKRGKVHELNRLILAKGKTSFLVTPEEEEFFKTIRYVLTLDGDAQLQRENAAKLIGTIAHPLNQAVLDPKRRVVTRGYGGIQPRVGVSLTSAVSSKFAAIFSGHAGLDPYTHTVSDVYQDLFDEGSYVGKGIYDVHTFERALFGRVPENALLSHDLFEGLFIRIALATDIELYDEFPSRYNSYARRQHRWVRGDWQLLPWILPLIPNESRKFYPSPLSLLERWKLFDNLRRSLVAPCLLLFLILAWLVLPGLPLFWSSLVVLILAFPVYANAAQAFLIPPVGLSLSIYAKGLGLDLMKNTQQALLSAAFLPHQAYLMVHAIITTLYRLFISREKLLEWESAYHSERRTGKTFKAFFITMYPAIVIAVLVGAACMWLHPERLAYAAPFLLAWIASPAIAYGLSMPVRPIVDPLSKEQENYLRQVAYDTWKFFRDFSEGQNHLIPDNLQLEPRRVIAERTSPSNIGLYQMSCISAYELGFDDLSSMITRLHNSFETLEKLERYRGHFLNWYQTQTLAPLHPRYVSFVDSGNFVALLVALREAIIQVPNLPFVRENFWTHVATQVDRNKKTFEQDFPQPPSSLSLKELVNAIDQLRPLHLPASERLVVDHIQEILRWYKNLETYCQQSERSYIATFEELSSKIACLNTLREIASFASGLGKLTSSELPLDRAPLALIIEQLNNAVEKLSKSRERILSLVTKYIDEAEFAFLYDHEKELFHIGYNVDDARKDSGHYDLLASEARLGSLVAIAKGEVPVTHWFTLGRSLGNTPGGKALLSWSGTMFEYLMPLIVAKNFPETLLYETYKAVVETQRLYGVRRGVPWGVSESAYSGVDIESTYQYRAFGVPQLGFKRGLENDLVISPYSSFLALHIQPGLVLNNLHALENEGLRGEYGFFESGDYTRDRLKDDEKRHVVKAVFAHHQGMSFLAITNTLCKNAIQNLFHSDPRIKAVELLLHEKFPQRVTLSIPHQAAQSVLDKHVEGSKSIPPRRMTTPHTSFPRTHILSNGHVTTMVDNSGSGFLNFEKEISLTRWREDALVNSYGTYIFVKDLDTGKLWSVAYQPTRVEPESYEVYFNSDKVEFKRRDFKIALHTEITVATDDNVEIRRVLLSNLSNKKRNLQVTSYAEIALASSRADAAHPAFSKMFIESEFLGDYDTLVFSRRPRSAKDEPLFLFHMIAMRTVWDRTRYETSRAEFLGRGNSIHSAAALKRAPKLGTIGFILDPIMSLSARIEIEPNSAESVSFITGASRDRAEVAHLAQKYQDAHQVNRAFEMAWSQSSVELRNEQFTLQQTHIFQNLANALIFSLESFRGDSRAIVENRLTQSALWRFGVSGDLPIVLLAVNDPSQIKLVQELIFAHYYLRTRGLAFDLIVLNEYPGGYFQNFQEELEGMLRSGVASGWVEKRGGIFIRALAHLSSEEITLLKAIARVSLSGANGKLEEQLDFPLDIIDEEDIPLSPTVQAIVAPEPAEKKQLRLEPSIEFFNKVGGFSEDGSCYSMLIQGDHIPPMPWSNVIANPTFGTLITESGGGYTWSQNSRENRISTWTNDPVSDPVTEAIYIRDTDSGTFWSPTPKPVRSGTPFRVEHRHGSSSFISSLNGIESHLTVSITRTDSTKYFLLKVKNLSSQARRLEIFLYVELVLGILREDAYRHIVTEFDELSQTLIARNFYNNEFAGSAVYLASTEKVASYTTDRYEFIGRNRDLSAPISLDQVGSTASRPTAILAPRRASVRLSQRVGAGFDPCGVLKVVMELDPHQRSEFSFILGEAPSKDVVRSRLATFRAPNFFNDELESSHQEWKNLTSAISVHTPVRSFDILVNGWLLYQDLSCRINGRTGFYQSGGAFGFRDQLQDVIALLLTDPQRTRDQILLHATRQFVEGDVQHWWHPPTGRGVRTKISDDFLWMPYVVERYIEVTGDESILDEVVGFIEGPQLGESHEAYIVPTESQQKATIYEHCIRALERGMTKGPHGLPLIGCGDWNDGMNDVGKYGRGESIWLGWFIALTIKKFDKFTQSREPERAEKHRAYASSVVEAIEKDGWDGDWYRRAYFDNGVPLGSKNNSECMIDSLAQTWSIISGEGNPERSQHAMQYVHKHLVREEDKLICLLSPPFNKSELEPGYIKGYLPGVRENGGQYTHGGVWVVIATALLGDGATAFKLFELLNPINHTANEEGVNRYKGEPYALCGDVYAVEPYVGRAGWSWYTGSAGWMYQAAIEFLLGLKVRPDHFFLDPCIPGSWPGFQINYTRGQTTYRVTVENPNGASRGVKSVVVDGVEVPDKKISYKPDAERVFVTVHMI